MNKPEQSLEPIERKDWLERTSDFLNPILVKETRQALKSRSFLSVFLLMLISSWLISAFGILYVYGPDLSYSAAGRSFFSAFYTVLSIAVFLVVPQGAFRSIQSERDLQTFEMLTITTLSPRKIVWGKWWSAVVQTIVYYAAIAPFMVFTHLLRGISLPFIAFILIWSFIGSALLAMVAITFSTFARQRQAFGLLQFLLILPLAFSLIGLLGVVYDNIRGDELPYDRVEFWFIQFVIASLLCPAFVLFRQIATANLMFEGANRSTGIRTTCFILLLIALTWMWLFSDPGYLPLLLSVPPSISVELMVTWTTMLGLWLWLIGLFASTEDDRLSRRVREELPRRGWVRLIVLPFYPGGGRGYLYFLLSVAILGLAGSHLISMSTGSPQEISRSQTMMIAMASYLLFYIGLTSVAGRMLRRLGPDLHASHARVLGILMASAGIVSPFLFVFWNYRFTQTFPVLMITNPFYSCYQLIYHPEGAPPLAAIAVLGLLGVLVNIRNLIEGIREFLTVNVTPPLTTATPAVTTIEMPFV